MYAILRFIIVIMLPRNIFSQANAMFLTTSVNVPADNLMSPVSPVRSVDLIDLIVEEQIKSSSSNAHTNSDPPGISLNSFSKNKTPSEQDDEDDEVLNLRKIWSRWSKWSVCTVTCGDGTIGRRRVCVSGRCAPGEVEEQRRPCLLSPCTVIDTNLEDTRDSK